MYCTKKITSDLIWLGGSDRRLALFENVYPIPRGVSYNAYLIQDEKTALLDTVDQAIAERFFENLEHALQGKPLNYVIVNHMEPDHAATLGAALGRGGRRVLLLLFGRRPDQPCGVCHVLPPGTGRRADLGPPRQDESKDSANVRQGAWYGPCAAARFGNGRTRGPRDKLPTRLEKENPVGAEPTGQGGKRHCCGETEGCF